MIIVGDKEKQAGNISVRHRSLGDLSPMGLDEFASKAKQEVLSKSLESVFARSSNGFGGKRDTTVNNVIYHVR